VNTHVPRCEHRYSTGLRFDTTVSLYSMILEQDEDDEDDDPVAAMLVIGSPEGNAGLVAALRNEANREIVDDALVAGIGEIQSPDTGKPQHPMVVLRTYENLQLVMDPDILRMIGAWMLEAAEWLEDEIEQG
jgi:hypothetical protein